MVGTDKAANLVRARKLVVEAAQSGAKVVSLPVRCGAQEVLLLGNPG